MHRQLEALTAAREIADGQDGSVLIAIHDLGLASRFADRLAMMKEGRIVAQGHWREVLTPQNIEAIYGVGALVGTDGDIPYVIPVQNTQPKTPSPL